MGVERHAEILEDEFQRVFSHSQCCSFVLPIYFLSEGFKASLESLWSEYG